MSRRKRKKRMESKEIRPDEELNQEKTDNENAEAEATAPEAEQENVQETPEHNELAEAKEKAAEYLAMAQRVQADFENFRRRNERVRADAFADGRREVATAMLPVLDNLERACEAAADSPDEALRNGVDLVLKQMNEAYRKLEVTPIDRLGEKFDPNLENAILQGAPEDGEPGTVCQVLQKGYRMGDRVIRHAMVKVVPE